MTKAPPPPSSSSTSQTTSAASSTDEYDATVTTAKATTAATPTEPSPSAENPHDECVLCYYPLPRKKNESTYYSCCRQLICDGCIIAQRRTLIIGTDVKKPIAGSREEELEFIAILSSEQIMVCPFCRAKDPTSAEEFVKRLWKRIDEYNDPIAMRQLGGAYLKGEYGLSKNLKKAEELYQQAYDFGDPNAAYHLANLYTEGIPDQARMMKYLEEGVQRENTHCNSRLGCLAARSGDHKKAKRCLMTAARSGHDKALHNLMVNYRDEPGSMVSKDDLATTLRAHKTINDAGKSEPREYAIRHKIFKEKRIALS